MLQAAWAGRYWPRLGLRKPRFQERKKIRKIQSINPIIIITVQYENIKDTAVMIAMHRRHQQTDDPATIAGD